MGSVDLIASSLDSIRQISDKIEDAVVYVDAGCSEAFQMMGAFSLLLELGVRTVCSLENTTALDATVAWNSASMDSAEKMVIITSRLLSDAHRYILRCLSTHQNVQSCSIFTSISEVAHSACVDSPLGPDAFHEYEVLLLQDYEELTRKSGLKKLDSHRHETSESVLRELEVDGSSTKKHARKSVGRSAGKGLDDRVSMIPLEANSWPKLTICVDHFPMVLCPLTPRVFILPSESSTGEACLSSRHEDALSPGLPAICTGMTSDSDDAPAGATLTAHFIYHLASKLDMKMEIFSLGDLSKSIGKMLTDMSSLYDVGRRNKRSAGLLLIDRSLDLLTPCCHGDSLLDRIFSSLPRRNRMSPTGNTKPSQSASKNSHLGVERDSLEVMIPLEFPDKLKSTVSSNLLSEHMEAFSSGWNAKPCKNNSSVEEEMHSQIGSLISSESYRGANYLEALLDRNTKDGTSLIKKLLVDIAQRDKVPLSRSQLSSVSKDLHSLVKVLCSQEKYLIKNKGIIQLAAAAETVLKEPHCSHWDALASAERMLAIGAGDTSQSLSSQIRDLLNSSSLATMDDLSGNRQSAGGLLLFKDALLLAVIGYILAGENFPTSGYNSPFSWEEERSLKEAVMDAILEMQTVPKYQFLNGLEEELKTNIRMMQSGTAEKSSKDVSADDDFDDQWGAWGDEDSEHNDGNAYGNMQLKLELRDRVDSLFKTFHKLSGMKWSNQIGQSSSQSNFVFDNYQPKGFLNRILNMVLAKYEVPGLEYHSSAMGRFLKSGLGRFGLGQSKPILGDQDTILVFIVGGISCQEVVEAREAIVESGSPEVELILGGTTLLIPDNMFELLLGSSSYI